MLHIRVQESGQNVVTIRRKANKASFRTNVDNVKETNRDCIGNKTSVGFGVHISVLAGFQDIGA